MPHFNDQNYNESPENLENEAHEIYYENQYAEEPYYQYAEEAKEYNQEEYHYFQPQENMDVNSTLNEVKHS